MNFGTLEQVDVRSVWSHEASDFTPWLSQNLCLLDCILNTSLILEACEVNVGSYRADLLVRDELTDQRMVIENQFGKSDHSHLGQILTYSSELESERLIWICESFTDQHLKVVNWLNESGIRLTAIELTLWKIGCSDVAPKLSKVNYNRLPVFKNRATSSCSIARSIGRGKYSEAIERILIEHPDWRNSQIARIVGCSHTQVATERKRILSSLVKNDEDEDELNDEI